MKLSFKKLQLNHECSKELIEALSIDSANKSLIQFVESSFEKNRDLLFCKTCEGAGGFGNEWNGDLDPCCDCYGRGNFKDLKEKEIQEYEDLLNHTLAKNKEFHAILSKFFNGGE